MTATEELRALLDELGVKWRRVCEDTDVEQTTEWTDRDGWECAATVSIGDGCDAGYVRLHMYATPAQAVEATLWRGECHIETEESCQNWNSCSECGADYYTDQRINYCPNCGRKVVE